MPTCKGPYNRLLLQRGCGSDIHLYLYIYIYSHVSLFVLLSLLGHMSAATHQQLPIPNSGVGSLKFASDCSARLRGHALTASEACYF